MREELEKLIAEATPGLIAIPDGAEGSAWIMRDDYPVRSLFAMDRLPTWGKHSAEDHSAHFDRMGRDAALLIFLWNNAPAILKALTERASMAAEIERLRADVARLREPHWLYLGDDCSSDQCRFGIDECIAEDFEWDNPPEGDHVLQISGARPVPDMWVALHYFTEEEMDQRDDDEPYTYTVHTTEEEARAALEARP